MEPLDDQEREFARILRALPGGEPPPALDAAILRAATNAAAASKRPTARILASAGALWGIGSAAAAVLALGVAWQIRYGNEPSFRAERAPHVQSVSEPADDDSVSVELSAQPADAPFVPPPPPSVLADKQVAPAAPQLRRQAEAKPSAAPAESMPAPAAEAFAQDQLDEHVARDAAAAAATASAETEAAAGLARDSNQPLREAAKAANAAAPVVMQAAPAAAPLPAAPASRADSGGAAASGLVGSTSALGGQDRERKEESALAKKPATWLVEIRRLRDQGHVEEARARLVEFHKTYPKWVIPTDLAPLLSE